MNIATADVRAPQRSAIVELGSASSVNGGLDPLDTWRSMLADGWDIVDQFERAGKRYWVAQAPELPSRARRLTGRERVVADGVARGHSNKLIAWELGLSCSTVAVYVKRASHKLGARSRLELICLFALL